MIGDMDIKSKYNPYEIISDTRKKTPRRPISLRSKREANQLGFRLCVLLTDRLLDPNLDRRQKVTMVR